MTAARAGLCLVAVLCLIAVPAQAAAAPIDDNIQLLRARPTGMDESTWRTKRREVAQELGDTRSPKAVDALIEVVETEKYDSVLTIAIQGLAKQGDPKAIAPLQKVYADRSYDTFVREEAATAIQALGGTPKDDARLVGGAGVAPTGESPAAGGGPQLGTMGAASVSGDEDLADLEADKPLPDNLRAREREFSFVVGQLDLAVNTLVEQQPVLADAGVGALARYVDERHRWGWFVQANLDSRIANGDVSSAPAGGEDTGNTLFIGQSLAALGDAHVYFGPTDFHAFAQLGISERVTYVGVDDVNMENSSTLRETRFALDIVPAGGVGWGRLLNGGSDLMVDGIVHALQDENILSRELDDAARKQIRDAVYRRSNAFSTYPRLAAVLTVLQRGGYLARRPSARVVHRLRSVLEDPSYLNRPQGVIARAGFLYGVPIAQNDFFRRGGDATGAPFVRLDAGIQIGRERQIVADTRFWFDVVGDRGFTTDSGVTYTRFFHTEFDDYRGQWFAGFRGGASRRTFNDLPADFDTRIGYRAIGIGGYAYGFRRGSEVSVAANAGVDSGGFVVGAGLALRFGLARGSVLNAPEKGRAIGRVRRGERGKAKK